MRIEARAVIALVRAVAAWELPVYIRLATDIAELASAGTGDVRAAVAPLDEDEAVRTGLGVLGGPRGELGVLAGEDVLEVLAASLVAKSLEPLDVLVTEKATGGQRADDRGADLMAAVWARADDVADAVVDLRGDPLGGAMPAVLLCEARQVAARARIVADRPARARGSKQIWQVLIDSPPLAHAPQSRYFTPICSVRQIVLLQLKHCSLL